ncbi:hypothetical protein CLV63_103143 [Murinocardiopsis flavida]|uniref:TadE-like domain-containing protein n=2 Tax=Murinocardiopsis flavida TaxID=645275 RepID=A0A2P8DQC1_9ACTN|nr:hypothetical protein CLV63_103143 [Murinocardiopsis flavida]
MSSAADHGTVTAETAVALPSLMLLLGIALAAIHAATTHLSCVDAARVGARALARGEEPDAVHTLIDQVAPPQARARISTDSRFARVRLSAPVPIAPGLPGPFEVHAEAATPVEESP